MTFRLRPTKGNVFIDPVDVKPDTFLHLPAKAVNQDLPHRGKVVAIGGDRITKKGVIVPPEFKVGDEVIFKRFTCLLVNVRGKKLVVVKQHDVEAGIYNDQAET